jgi:hypothetical protein
MDALRNLIQAEVARAIKNLAHPRHARITSYDPATPPLVMVQLLPQADYPQQEGEVAETNWVPIHHPMTGDGTGVFCGPTPGDQVQLTFQQNDPNSPVATTRIGDDDHLPPSGIESGEFWALVPGGVFLKLLAAGTVISAAPNGYTWTGPHVFNGDVLIKGNVTVEPGTSAGGNAGSTGAIAATGNITSQAMMSAVEGISTSGAMQVVGDVIVGYGGVSISVLTHFHKNSGGSGNGGVPVPGS